MVKRVSNTSSFSMCTPLQFLRYTWALTSVQLVRPDPSCCDRRWLLGLLVLQSMSSFVLDSYQELLRNHLVVTLFLTMLVGAGGNAGNQSAIKVIRGLVYLCLLLLQCWMAKTATMHYLWALHRLLYTAMCVIHLPNVRSCQKNQCEKDCTAALYPACSACRRLEGSGRPALPSGRQWHSSASLDCCWLQG